MGGCQNYGPFLGSYYDTDGTYYLGYPKRDPNFDNHPGEVRICWPWRPTTMGFGGWDATKSGFKVWGFRGLGFRVKA